MDPGQRLLLEETWRCIEDSGVSLAHMREKKTSVFVGAATSDYLQEASSPRVRIDSYTLTGNYSSLLSNRISHFFGFDGPSISLDTACSSSLFAIEQAKNSLLSLTSDYSLAAGVNVNLHPLKYISLSAARIVSPDGRCKTFDKDADGYVPGDGVGVLLLRRLEEAVAGGDHIHGVVKGLAASHMGFSLALTAPRKEAQKEVVSRALREARVDPITIRYVEAHGTGTSLGDPIEMDALTSAFREFTDRRGFCKTGSVKTNIGHLEGASGMAGVV
ncbi:MAG: polyketide synthase, partial [Desulfobacterales bacterium]|nr:polyketide synthase [Desulfobacterales bacterium]